MDYKERLKEYIENDVIYSEYKSGKCDMSDFDKFCIEHCKDIESLLNENEELQLKKQRYKKVIDEAIEQMESWYFALDYAERDRLKIIVEILKEVTNEKL